MSSWKKGERGKKEKASASTCVIGEVALDRKRGEKEEEECSKTVKEGSP